MTDKFKHNDNNCINNISSRNNKISRVSAIQKEKLQNYNYIK